MYYTSRRTLRLATALGVLVVSHLFRVPLDARFPDAPPMLDLMASYQER